MRVVVTSSDSYTMCCLQGEKKVKFISSGVSAPSLDISLGSIDLILVKSLFVHLSHNEVIMLLIFRFFGL